MKLTRGRKAAILIGIVIFIVGASTAGSYAMWSVNGAISSTVNAGVIDITANSSAATTLAGLASTQVGPGVTATTSVTVGNASSTLPMTYTTTLANVEAPTTSAFGDNITYVVWVASGNLATNCVVGSAVISPSWTGTLATGTTTLGAGRALAAGASEVLCVRTTMSATAPSSIQGQSVTSTLTFTGSSI
jgi:hypothetical protein